MATINEQELDKIYAFAIQLGKDAGTMLQQAANARIAGRARTNSIEKASAVDIVTETDEGMWMIRRKVLQSACKLNFVRCGEVYQKKNQ
jgi:myo-inositol-1(or 4)-monophosphatase